MFTDIVYYCVKSRTLHAKGSMQLLTHRTLLGLPYTMVPAAILIGYHLMQVTLSHSPVLNDSKIILNF